eukprot:scaffold31844_cov27-Tisochrysis_lutea.AAC.3
MLRPADDSWERKAASDGEASCASKEKPPRAASAYEAIWRRRQGVLRRSATEGRLAGFTFKSERTSMCNSSEYCGGKLWNEPRITRSERALKLSASNARRWQHISTKMHPSPQTSAGWEYGSPRKSSGDM